MSIPFEVHFPSARDDFFADQSPAVSHHAIGESLGRCELQTLANSNRGANLRSRVRYDSVRQRAENLDARLETILVQYRILGIARRCPPHRTEGRFQASRAQELSHYLRSFEGLLKL